MTRQRLLFRHLVIRNEIIVSNLSFLQVNNSAYHNSRAGMFMEVSLNKASQVEG